MNQKILNILQSGHSFLDSEDELRYKFLFLNNVIMFAIVVAILMSIKRYSDGSILLAVADVSFSAFLMFLLYMLKIYKTKFELISNLTIISTFILMLIVFVLASGESTRISLFFIFISSVVFLKGRLVGFFYLVATSVFIATIQFLVPYETNYTNLDLLLVFLYSIVFYLIIGLYENIKHSQNDILSKLLSQRHLEKQELEYIINTFNKTIIFSKTDLKGRITYVNEAFCEVSGYIKEELIGKSHNIVRHQDMPKEVFTQMWNALKEHQYWRGEVKNRKKNGGFYWVDAIIEADYNAVGEHIGYHAVRQNITTKKEVEVLKQNLEEVNEHLEEQVNERILEVVALNKDIKETQKEIIFTMGAIGESRSKETANHVKRVAEYSKLLAQYCGLDKYKAELIRQASPMHDIGKVGIPDAILNKPGRLTQDEMKIMMTHSKLGYNMLKSSDKELLKIAALVAKEHHEKYDGTGYPNALAGENISIEGRITAVADVFDALGSDRVYKKAWADEDIFKMFIEEKGKHFDPLLVDIFLENKEDFIEIRDRFKDC